MSGTPTPGTLTTAASGAGARPRFERFDALRAIAALAIVATHAGYFSGASLRDDAVGYVSSRLDVGVAVFFVISGFLLSRPFVAAHLTDGAVPRPGGYVLRRVARIVPAYWLALLGTALLLNLDYVLSPDGLRYWLFGQIYWEDSIGKGLVPAWSLCVEITFYAFLPLWAWAMRRAFRAPDPVRRSRDLLLAIAAMGVASLAYKAVVVLTQDDLSAVVTTPLLISLPAYLDQFALGMALAVLSVRRIELGLPGGRTWRLVERRPGTAWAVAAAAFAVAAVGIGIDRAFAPMNAGQVLGLRPLYGIVGVALVLPAVVGGTGGLVRGLLSNRVLLWLGVVSYGLYLWHLPLLDRLNDLGWGDVDVLHEYLWWPVGGLLAGAAAAALSWYLMERPLLDLVHGRRRRPRVPAVAEAAVASPVAPRREDAVESRP